LFGSSNWLKEDFYEWNEIEDWSPLGSD
jgi:hypothetical protein